MTAQEVSDASADCGSAVGVRLDCVTQTCIALYQSRSVKSRAPSAAWSDAGEKVECKTMM